MKNRIVISELERLNARDVITDKTLKDIKNYYENEKKEKNFSSYLTIIGLVMISLGVILLFAYNWSHLTRVVKMILLILLLASSQGLFGYALFHKKSWLPGAGATVFAMSGLSIAMVSQMYNISGSDTSYYMTWLILNTPTLYLCRSKVIGIPYAVIGYRYLAAEGNILIYIALMIVPLLLDNSKERWSRIGSSVIKLIFLFGIFYWYEGLTSTGRYYLPFYGGVLTLLYLWPTGLKGGAEIFILFFAYLQTLAGGYFGPEVTGFTTKLVLSWSVYGAALISLIFLKKWKDPVNYFILLIPPIFFWGAGELVCNIYLFSSGIYFIWKGLRENTVRVFNKGNILVCLILISRFLDYDISNLVRGIVFIAIGVGFIIGNMWISRRKV